jgi:hypothetical protein
MFTFALFTALIDSIVEANSPSIALKYLIFCSKSVAPNSCLSNKLKPTLLFLGSPKAAT